ncbi:MAG: hypothetical protein ABI571_06955 [Actinomycetota bacterium]
MVARVLVVMAGYLLFSAMGDDRLAAGVALWAGTVLTGWYLVDLVTLGRDGSPGIGTGMGTRLGRWGAALGGACIAAGIVLAL